MHVTRVLGLIAPDPLVRPLQFNCPGGLSILSSEVKLAAFNGIGDVSFGKGSSGPLVNAFGKQPLGSFLQNRQHGLEVSRLSLPDFDLSKRRPELIGLGHTKLQAKPSPERLPRDGFTCQAERCKVQFFSPA